MVTMHHAVSHHVQRESDASMWARFLDAVAVPIDPATAPPDAMAAARHGFDFDGGLRLLISIDDFGADGRYLHVSASGPGVTRATRAAIRSGVNGLASQRLGPRERALRSTMLVLLHRICPLPLPADREFRIAVNAHCWDVFHLLAPVPAGWATTHKEGSQ